MILTPQALTSDVFSPYGDVVETGASDKAFPMNYGLATRHFNLANVDVDDNSGKTCISIVNSNSVKFPFTVEKMEYHPFGSQLFYPLCKSPFLILVSPPAEKLNTKKLALFISNGEQGINYHKGVWHHYLLPLNDASEFIVVDRVADDDNCIEAELENEIIIALD